MTTTPNADALSALLSETLKEEVKRFPAVACADIIGCEDIDDIHLTDIQQCVAASDYSALLSKNAALAAENERLREAMWKAAREMQGVGTEASLEFHRMGLDSAYQILQSALSSIGDLPAGEEG